MDFVYNDGGRAKYFKGSSGDCVTRAISIATGKDYKDVYDLVNSYAKKERVGKRKKGISDARTGVYKNTVYRILTDLGYKWIPTMGFGTGCQVHLKKEELPSGTIIVRLSKHLTTVVDGVINDTYNPSRNGCRCVYGYYIKDEKKVLA